MPVATFYRFTPLPDPAALRAALLPFRAELTGTIILAPEGVNGTVAGPSAALNRLAQTLAAEPGLADLALRLSPGDATAFGRFKVKLKGEIVTLGQPGVNARATGTKIAAADWNAVLSDPDTVVIDTRNGFEVAAGSFPGAINPGTVAFRDFPARWAELAPQIAGRRVAMFCTGGIRCEKASAWLLAQGLPEVLQLQGGILAYLEHVPAAESLWQGECFVFDTRGALGPGLTPA